MLNNKERKITYAVLISFLVFEIALIFFHLSLAKSLFSYIFVWVIFYHKESHMAVFIVSFLAACVSGADLIFLENGWGNIFSKIFLGGLILLVGVLSRSYAESLKNKRNFLFAPPDFRRLKSIVIRSR